MKKRIILSPRMRKAISCCYVCIYFNLQDDKCEFASWKGRKIIAVDPYEEIDPSCPLPDSEEKSDA